MTSKAGPQAAIGDRRRVVICDVVPQVDGGEVSIKRVIGDSVNVEANIFADGHDELAFVLLYKRAGDSVWRESEMAGLGNDRWQGSFAVDEIGRWQYSIQAWIDRFGTWQERLKKLADAGQLSKDSLVTEFQFGAALVSDAAEEAECFAALGDSASESLPGADKGAIQLVEWAEMLVNPKERSEDQLALALSSELRQVVYQYQPRRFATTFGRELSVVVDRPLAKFAAWYEVFPRSCASKPGQHGTLADLIARLPLMADMGFDLVYLPPIHPIGMTGRKGRDGSLKAGVNDPGSPWAIGSKDGGHKSIHPQLGNFSDFRKLLLAADDLGLEIALDIALQCSPDHPYVREHPDWFVRRADGTFQTAENPPKKYEDIYQLDFESADVKALWHEVKSIFDFWINKGVRVFRVDNPHTKPLAFWRWLIERIKDKNPDVLFLSEAFTRPAMMHELAKAGFSLSYTYFTWRNTKSEVADYFTELNQGPAREYFRPSVWPNTPDILHAYLQEGGPGAFEARFILAATLAGNYGIFGSSFEMTQGQARSGNSEEYAHSEKYEIRNWDWDLTAGLRPLIAKVNGIRRDNQAFAAGGDLTFHRIDNDQLICYSRAALSNGVEDNAILVIVNIDSKSTQAGWTDLDKASLGLTQGEEFWVDDLLTGKSYQWTGARNFVELNPDHATAHIFRIRRLGVSPEAPAKSEPTARVGKN